MGEGGQLGSGRGRQSVLLGGGCWLATGPPGLSGSCVSPWLTVPPPQGQAHIGPLEFLLKQTAPPRRGDKGSRSGQHGFLSVDGLQGGHAVGTREAGS